MKKTRLVALVALVVVCIAGWAILVLNTMNEVKTQQNTVEAAQYYRGKNCSSFRCRTTRVPLRKTHRGAVR